MVANSLNKIKNNIAIFFTSIFCRKETEQHLNSVHIQNITKSDIENKRNEVRKNYNTYGFESTQYNKSFDKLHDLILLKQANEYRKENNLSFDCITPYCESN